MLTQSDEIIVSPNDFLIRRAKKVLIETPAGPERLPQPLIAAFAKNLEGLGFVMSHRLMSACTHMTLTDITALHQTLMKNLREMKGAHHDHKPMYPNFPRQVMEMDKAELYINAIVHYVTDGKFIPGGPKKERHALIENSSLEILDLGSAEELDTSFQRLATANGAWSAQDRQDIAVLARYYGKRIFKLLPILIPNRENKAFLIGVLLAPENAQHTEKLAQLCTTATDVLRIAVASSDGDISLAEPVKFRRFARKERRLLLGLLENQSNVLEDMLRWDQRWIRLGERLHPGEFQRLYPKSADAFSKLRNDAKIETFNSHIEKALGTKNIADCIELLSKRPGDFARRLDHLLRICDKRHQDKVLLAFAHKAQKISTPVLVQLAHHFRTRKRDNFRAFFPKGQVAKVQVIENKLPDLPQSLCEAVAVSCREALMERFSQLPDLGKVFVDPQLMNYSIPFSQRSASKSLRTISRGSRLPMPKKDILRFFIWWKNGSQRTDIDLSAVAFDENYCYVDSLSFYNLQAFGGVHSGDIVDAPTGASEFIDISVSRCRERKIRFVVMSVNNYTNQSFCDLPECFAGWMGRSEADSGEIYEPKTVIDKIDLASNTRIAVPALFDLERSQVIWMDIGMTRNPNWYNTVPANLYSMQLMLKTFVEGSMPNLFTLLQLHAQARGELVATSADADVSFCVDSGIQFKSEKILSEFLHD